MGTSDSLTFPAASWESEYLEDTSLRQTVLDYYDREHASLLRYVIFLGVDPETAREIVQDCFLKLHEHLRAGSDTSQLRAWLYRVAHNLARNARASASATKTSPLVDLSPSAEPQSLEITPEQELLERERLRRLRRSIDGLSVAQRECLVLRSQGLKYREIAQVLNLSVSAVAENVQRALSRLKDLQ
jgi:RNA polymerase sigma-70 factor (ECF subfamily)